MTTPEKFLESAISAFPSSRAVPSAKAAYALLPYVDTSYHREPLTVFDDDGAFKIPRRIAFTFANPQELLESVESKLLQVDDDFSTEFYCLLTRSVDGYIRQSALSHVLRANTPWSIVYVMQQASEYVVEIIQDIISGISMMDRSLYKSYALSNRSSMYTMQQRAASYWNCYYRWKYPDKRTYPGIAFYLTIAAWAQEP